MRVWQCASGARWLMPKWCLVGLLSWLLAGAAVADDTSAAEVESLKEAVLTLNRDLLILEEELLYPASSQVVVYVSMDLGQFFALDAIKLDINGQLVASELYSDKQTRALFRGGVQRLYQGNLKAGDYEISAFFTGKGPQQDGVQAEYKRGASLSVTKGSDPLVLELRIVDSSAQLQPVFDIKQWQPL